MHETLPVITLNFVDYCYAPVILTADLRNTIGDDAKSSIECAMRITVKRRLLDTALLRAARGGA
jgi:hypothetical protein